MAKSLDIDTALALLKARFKAEDADNLTLNIQLNLTDENEPRNLVIRNNVLHIEKDSSENTDATIQMARDTLNQIIANMTTFQEALDQGKLTTSVGDKKSVQRFVRLIE